MLSRPLWMIRPIAVLCLCLAAVGCSSDDGGGGDASPQDSGLADTSQDAATDTDQPDTDQPDADVGAPDTADADDSGGEDTAPTEQCTSGEDDDGDGDIDCEDSDCDDAPACVVSTVAAGWTHACATFGDGRVRCWGDDSAGALGDDGVDANPQPPVVVNGIEDATDVVVGREFSCALHQDQTVSCWGSNEYGQLGDGSYIDSSVPVSVSALGDATAITAGEYSACAVRETGQVVCWGGNDQGQLGDGTTDHSNEPTDVQFFALLDIVPLDDAVDVDCHGEHCCALRESTGAACWGRNRDGMLAAGHTSENSDLALAVVDQTNPIRTLTDISDIGVAYTFSCFAKADESVWCAGEVPALQVDWGGTGWPDVAVELDLFSDAVDIWGGTAYACALRSTGRLLCWGANGSDQTGDPSSGYSSGYQLPGVENPLDFSAGDAFNCFVSSDQDAYCFGLNTSRQLGVDTAEESTGEPQRVQF